MNDAYEAKRRMQDILDGSWLSASDYEAAVSCVSDAAGDDEMAHGMQDSLVERALRDIATLGMPGDDAQAIAEAVVKVFDIDFSRWCA